MKIVFGVYIITFLIFLLTEMLCIKAHSKFPNTSIGFHVLWAIKSEELWIAANKVSGYLCILISVISFLALPIVFYLFKLDLKIQLLVYFLVSLISTLLIIALPKRIVKKIYPSYFMD